VRAKRDPEVEHPCRGERVLSATPPSPAISHALPNVLAPPNFTPTRAFLACT
jgi:hypothetical protein